MHTLKITTASVALALSIPLAQAKDKWEFHEEQWKQVAVHEKRMVSDDSLSSWGPWEDIAPTGAGGGSASGPTLGFLPQGLDEVYRPTATAMGSSAGSIGALFACGAGEICGFAVYTNSNTSNNGSKTISKTSAIAPALLNMSVSPNSNAVTWRLTQLDALDDAPTYNNLGEIAARVSDPLNFVASATQTSQGAGGSVDTLDKVNGGSKSQSKTSGSLSHDVSTYIKRSGMTSGVTMTSSYVAGTPTPVADLSALLAGNVSASYSGSAASGSSVNLTVNFGSSTWSGSWNDGKDGKTSPTNVGGVLYRAGAVGFVANGTISGQTFQSTGLSAKDAASVTGSVQGAFFGSNAQSLGGVADITKTITNTNVYKHVDVFSADKVVAPQ